MTWQPIETAPKDFTNILIWVDFIDAPGEGDTLQWQIEGGYMVVMWDEETNRWEPIIAALPEGSIITPSHWMPLPDPPSHA